MERSRIGVLIVDDASAVRRLVASALNRDPELEVVGVAPDGEVGLTRVTELQPDVVILDLEMPVLDGLQTLVALRKTHPRLPVIMFSQFTQRGVEATVRALTLGADDYVPKPGTEAEVVRCIDEILIPKIKLLVRRRTVHLQAGAIPARVSDAAGRPASPAHRVDVIVIGASTGGPKALAEIFPVFHADWSIPLVVVQHMPPDFTARLAERLTETSSLIVREGVSDALISAAQAWIAPGGHHAIVKREQQSVRLVLNQDPPVNSCRPSVDVLFQSAADVYGPGVLAVVLTGMGQDGLRGCEDVRNAGGHVIVQDEATSVVWSMPGAVARAGLASEVLALEHVGPAIVRRAQSPRAAQSA